MIIEIILLVLETLFGLMVSTHCLAAAFVKVNIRALASSKQPCIKEEQQDREISGLLKVENIIYWRGDAYKGRALISF